ncbi:MAG: hypothetical protein H7Y31_11420 [Chitinophagaceae bacterium]|nr:hypothetical protein [Chitinophagaceae bacterium]
MRRAPLLLFFLLLSTNYLLAQQPRQYSFTHYGPATGLASNETFAVVQDQAGYMWIGTNNGLQRFDGIRYETFRHLKGDPKSIPHNFIQQLLIDKKNNLWVVTVDGRVGIFDKSSFRYKEAKIAVDNPETIRTERGLMQDLEGNLFIIYYSNILLTYNAKTHEFSKANNFVPLPDGFGIVGIAQQPGTKKYWLTCGKGLAVYNLETKNLNYKGNNPDNESAIDTFGHILNPGQVFFDQQSRLWFNAWLGMPKIFAYDLKNHRIVLNDYSFTPQIKAYHETRGFMQQKDGTIWMFGVPLFARFDEKNVKFQLVYNSYRNEQSIDYDGVISLYEDREQNIWVATDNNGLYQFNPAAQFFSNIRHINRSSGQLGEGAVMSFLLTKKGVLHTGAWSDGLYAYDSNYNNVPVQLGDHLKQYNPWAWCMSYSRDSNTIWIGAQPGIYRHDERTNTTQFFNPAILKKRTIRQVLEDGPGNLWIGTQNIGLYRWVAKNGKKNFDDGIEAITDIGPNAQILKIYRTKNGQIWVGTARNGVYVFDEQTAKLLLHLGTSESGGHKLQWDNISSILQYDDSTMTIAAHGIYFFNTNQNKISKFINLPESQASNIASIEKDRDGYIWISLSNGIFRLNPKNEIFIHFDRVDGIANDHFDIAASYVLPEGKILFGAANQFVSFDPSQVRINDPAPDLHISGFKLMSDALSVDSLLAKKRIELSSEDNSITIEFTGLSYSRVYITEYLLEGLEKEWRMADKNNQAIYSYLPPGSYTFRARTRDAEGNPGKELTLELEVLPPFYKTWWFYGLLVLAIIFVLYWYDRERTARKEALQKMRGDIAGNLHTEVNTALNNINILSEMARLKSGKDPAKSNEYIEQIHNKSHNMIIAMDDMLWSLDAGNDNMQKTVERMREYIDALNSRHGVHIDIKVDKDVMNLAMNMKLRHESLLLFKEGINNLVVAGVKNCQIHIGFERSRLQFTMQFDNSCCDMQQLNNILHRQDMEKRLNTIGAALDVHVQRSNSVFVIQVPVQ